MILHGLNHLAIQHRQQPHQKTINHRMLVVFSYLPYTMNTRLKLLWGIIVLLIAFLVALSRVWDKPPPSHTAGEHSAVKRAESRKKAELSAFHESSRARLREVGATSPDITAGDATATADKHADMEKMNDAATTYDPAQLVVIRPYLVSADPDLREAAVDAMIVLGDASAGAMLREAASGMESAEEAKAMMEAADYVELPPANLRELSKRAKERPAGNQPPKREKK